MNLITNILGGILNTHVQLLPLTITIRQRTSFSEELPLVATEYRNKIMDRMPVDPLEKKFKIIFVMYNLVLWVSDK